MPFSVKLSNSFRLEVYVTQKSKFIFLIIFLDRDVIEYGTYQIPAGVVGKFNMSLLPIPDGVFGEFFFAQAADGPLGSVTLVNEGETLESQSNVGPYLYFVPGRDGKPLSLNWWHAGSAFNNSPIFQDNFKSGIETIDYTSKRECRHVSLTDMVSRHIFIQGEIF